MPIPPIRLQPHPAHPSPAIDTITVSVERAGAGLALCYRVQGDLDHVRLPRGESGVRRDALWQQSCFELFVRDGASDGYFEYNFSPGGDWAAYTFQAYRAGGEGLACLPPKIELSQSGDHLQVAVSLFDLPAQLASEKLLLGPSVILNAANGTRSYWALDHLGETPDFHRSETFKLSVD